MWFKQAQLFQLSEPMRFSSDVFNEKLTQFIFEDCLPSIPFTAGWIPPIDEEGAPLAYSMNGYTILCLQVEEKILPSMVIRQELNKKVKEIEALENRKVGPKEKYALKDEITATLLPRAFSKLTKIYAYIDAKNSRLILSTVNAKKTEQFLVLFRKTFCEHINSLEIKHISATMTSWLKQQNYPSSFSIEKACVLQDVNAQNRVIRCKEQNLFANSIQALLKDGCAVMQLAMNWQDRVDFVLMDNLFLQSIRFKDEVIAEIKEMEVESQRQQFMADFLLMTATFDSLFAELLEALNSPSVASISNAVAVNS